MYRKLVVKLIEQIIKLIHFLQINYKKIMYPNKLIFFEKKFKKKRKNWYYLKKKEEYMVRVWNKIVIK